MIYDSSQVHLHKINEQLRAVIILFYCNEFGLLSLSVYLHRLLCALIFLVMRLEDTITPPKSLWIRYPWGRIPLTLLWTDVCIPTTFSQFASCGKPIRSGYCKVVKFIPWYINPQWQAMRGNIARSSRFVGSHLRKESTFASSHPRGKNSL